MLNYNPCLKRFLDIFLALSAILILLPVFLVIAFLIQIDFSGPVFFRQKRVGKNFKSFTLIKFRSMKQDNNSIKKQFEPGDDRRVTRIGKILRKTKLDELPELFNVLAGDMSIVGPRPEVEKYVAIFRDDYKLVLKIRPGLSDLASIIYRNEEEILAGISDPEKFYIEQILPDKLKLAKEYIEKLSFKTDLIIILDTLKKILSKDNCHKEG